MINFLTRGDGKNMCLSCTFYLRVRRDGTGLGEGRRRDGKEHKRQDDGPGGKHIVE